MYNNEVCLYYWVNLTNLVGECFNCCYPAVQLNFGLDTKEQCFTDKPMNVKWELESSWSDVLFYIGHVTQVDRIMSYRGCHGNGLAQVYIEWRCVLWRIPGVAKDNVTFFPRLCNNSTQVHMFLIRWRHVIKQHCYFAVVECVLKR